MVSLAKMAVLQSSGKLHKFSIQVKKTYSDNPHYLIHSIKVINLPNMSKVFSKCLPLSRSFPTLPLRVNTQPYQI